MECVGNRRESRNREALISLMEQEWVRGREWRMSLIRCNLKNRCWDRRENRSRSRSRLIERKRKRKKKGWRWKMTLMGRMRK